MFGSTPTEREAPFRQLTGRVWRRAGQLWRQTSLRIAVILHGENVDPETLAVTLDKDFARRLAASAGVPVPRGVVLSPGESADAVLEKILNFVETNTDATLAGWTSEKLDFDESATLS